MYMYVYVFVYVYAYVYVCIHTPLDPPSTWKWGTILCQLWGHYGYLEALGTHDITITFNMFLSKFVCQIYIMKRYALTWHHLSNYISHLHTLIQLHIPFRYTSLAVKFIKGSLVTTFHQLEVLGGPDGPTLPRQETYQRFGGVIDLAHTCDIHGQLSVSG